MKDTNPAWYKGIKNSLRLYYEEEIKIFILLRFDRNNAIEHFVSRAHQELISDTKTRVFRRVPREQFFLMFEELFKEADYILAVHADLKDPP